MNRPLPRLLRTCLLAALPLPAAALAGDGGPEFKLTQGWYANSDRNNAEDTNLRADFGAQKVWLGEYLDHQGFRQTRTGYEADPDFGWINFQLSAQAASRGFFGGSVQANVGGDDFAILGIGRTNLKPYYNLNFDPNDAWTLGLGSNRLLPGGEVSLYQVRDDRLHTGQRITHALLKFKLDEDSRLTVDATYKSGLDPDDHVRVRGYGLALEYDHRKVFCKFAHEHGVNFSRVDQTRIAVGWRF